MFTLNLHTNINHWKKKKQEEKFYFLHKGNILAVLTNVLLDMLLNKKCLSISGGP